MKRKTTKEILTESFQELTAKKKVDKITIQEIVDNCGYSPAWSAAKKCDTYDIYQLKRRTRMNKKYSEEMKEETALYILESGKPITNATVKRGTLLKQRESIRMISKD